MVGLAVEVVVPGEVAAEGVVPGEVAAEGVVQWAAVGEVVPAEEVAVEEVVPVAEVAEAHKFRSLIQIKLTRYKPVF